MPFILGEHTYIHTMGLHAVFALLPIIILFCKSFAAGHSLNNNCTCGPNQILFYILILISQQQQQQQQKYNTKQQEGNKAKRKPKKHQPQKHGSKIYIYIYLYVSDL